jgi:hypothetical protein
MVVFNWSQLIYVWLHGHPFVGAVKSNPEPSPWRSLDPQPSPWRALEPEPSPWRLDVSGPDEIVAAASLLTAISLKVAAAGMPVLEGAMETRISALIDDYCGTPPGHPWPGPWQFPYGLAAGLSFLAGTLAPQSKLQTAVQEVSVRILRRIDQVALNPQPLPP